MRAPRTHKSTLYCRRAFSHICLPSSNCLFTLPSSRQSQLLSPTNFSPPYMLVEFHSLIHSYIRVSPIPSATPSKGTCHSTRISFIATSPPTGERTFDTLRNRTGIQIYPLPFRRCLGGLKLVKTSSTIRCSVKGKKNLKKGKKSAVYKTIRTGGQNRM